MKSRPCSRSAAIVGALGAEPLSNLLNQGSRLTLIVAVAVLCAITAGIAMLSNGFGGSTALTIVLTLGAGLLFLNRGPALWFACLLLMTMFVGTVMYRAAVGEVSWKSAWAIYLGALVAIVIAHLGSFTVYADPLSGAKLTMGAELATFFVAYGLFALGLVLRHVQIPKFLAWFGLISYSLYLSHPIIINAVPPFGVSVAHHAVLTVAAWMACSIATAAFSYYLIEKPFMQLGKKMARRVGHAARVVGSSDKHRS